MSAYVDDIINDLKTIPETFIDFCGQGVKKGNILISQYGNSRALSVIHLNINSYDMPLTYIDSWKLEVAIGKWYKNANLKTVMRK